MRIRLRLAAAASAALIAAACGGHSHHASPGTIDLHGTALAGPRLWPAAGIVVLTTGHTPVQTGADGSFTITGVHAPYDLTLIDAPNHIATVWRGLTRPDPAIWGAASPSSSQAMVDGDVLGGGGSSGALVVVGSNGAYGATALGGGTTFTNLVVTWRLAPAIDATLVGGRYNPDLTALGTTTLHLASGDHPTGVTVGLSNVTTTSAPVAITGVATGMSGQAVVQIETGGQPSLGVASLTISSDGTYSLPVVSTPAMTHVLSVEAGAPGLGILSARATGLTSLPATVALRAPPAPLLPIPDATGVGYGTTFSWAPGEGTGVYEVGFQVVGGFVLDVIQSGTSTTLPDLSAAGIALPPSAMGSWQVTERAPYASVDALAGAGVPLDGTIETVSHEATRNFTTAP
jgi:hypothetical protein